MSEIRIGAIQSVTTQSGRLTGYRLELYHTALHEHRLLRAPDKFSLKNKADIQIAAWNEKWQKIASKTKLLQNQTQGKENAELQTEQAQAALLEASTLLVDSAEHSHRVDWRKLEDRGSFIFNPGNSYPNIDFKNGSGAPIGPIYQPSLPEPSRDKFYPEIGFLDYLIPGRVKKKRAISQREFAHEHQVWESKVSEIHKENEKRSKEFEVVKDIYFKAKKTFERNQQNQNDQLYAIKSGYEENDGASVISFVNIVLDQSKYPEWISKDYIAAFNPDNSVLIVDFTLPTPEVLPSTTKVTYVSSRNEIKTYFLSDAEKARLYESVLYQISLCTIHEIFSADYSDKISTIVFNGWLTWTSKATGAEETGCLLSLQTTKHEAQKIDFSKVDPKACFRALKGISAAKLSGITPIAPIAQINMDDARFIASHNVMGTVESGTNIAEIDWEEFEHLVRELFAQEFGQNGGEVKITRASSDGGVDAVAFDPDPIRGGKIVIQAKRYTNTVGVAAVRDLFGTMMNEGAMKGILVTTSDYGSDSYAFARNKPITLLNGSNLLQLLEKHGHKARIDLAEARRNRELKIN